MAEYIDKANLVERLESRVKDYGRDCNGNAPIISRTYQAVLHMVENLPTADVVSVVRCGKCKWFGVDSTKGGFCMRKDSPSMWRNETGELKPDDYCSYGERRGSDEKL